MARAKAAPAQVGDTVSNEAFTGTVIEAHVVSVIVEFPDGSTQRCERKLWKVVAS